MEDFSKYFDSDSLICRRIETDQIPTVVDLINKEYSYQDEYRGDTRTNFGDLSDLISKTEFYVFKDDEEIAGCVYIELDDPDVAYLGLLTIADKHKGKGYGRKITKSVEEYAKNKGKNELLLAYMHIAPSLKDYYEKLGFSENGVVWEWDGIKLINMSKKLT